MKLALLNTTIATTDGVYEIETISLDKARQMILGNIGNLDSAVGHQSTADVMTTLLSVNIPMNRQMFTQEVGQNALVFKLHSRTPEGKILTADEIEEIGYDFKVMTRKK